MRIVLTNNDVFRRLRYTFNFREQTLVSIFALAHRQVTSKQVELWLKKDDEPEMLPMSDPELASFLNGFIVEKRGYSDKGVPIPETNLTKNLILQKLKIALSLTSDDIIALFKQGNVVVGKAELSALFRKSDHKHYRACKAQFLRNFLMALQNHYRSNPSVNKQATHKQKHPLNKPAKQKTLYVNPKLTNSVVTKKSPSGKTLRLNNNSH